MDDPSYWRTVKDKFTGKEVVLSDQQLDMVRRIQRAEYPNASYNPYEVCGGGGRGWGIVEGICM